MKNLEMFPLHKRYLVVKNRFCMTIQMFFIALRKKKKVLCPEVQWNLGILECPPYEFRPKNLNCA